MIGSAMNDPVVSVTGEILHATVGSEIVQVIVQNRPRRWQRPWSKRGNLCLIQCPAIDKDLVNGPIEEVVRSLTRGPDPDGVGTNRR